MARKRSSRHKICEHGKEHCRCKECGGSQVCRHGRYSYTCKECPGKGICEHGKNRSECRQCGNGTGLWTCLSCGTKFYKPTNEKYCSNECLEKYQKEHPKPQTPRKLRICPVSGIEFYKPSSAKV